MPTPLIDGVPHLGFIEDAGRHLAPLIRPWLYGNPRIHDLSGHNRGIAGSDPRKRFRADRPVADFHVGYSPERIDPGNPRWNLVNTPKVVSGIDGAVARGGAVLLRQPGRARPSPLAVPRWPS